MAMAADLIIYGGTVWPVTAAPIPGAAVAVSGDRILAVGSPADVEPLLGPGTRVLRLGKDQHLLPGFNDAHQHIQAFAQRQNRISLWETRSVGEVLDRLAAEAAVRPGGAWIWAVGHDQGRLAEGRHPTLAELDRVAPDHPVLISRACGHIALANSRALAAAGLAFESPDPPGGRLERAGGALTGVLLEGAQAPVKAAMPAEAVDWPKELRQAAAEYHKRGITSIAEASVGNKDEEEAERLLGAFGGGVLGLRICLMPRGKAARRVLAAGGPMTGSGDEWVRWGPIKLVADGTLGGGTAYLSEPYGDEPENRGWPVLSQEELNQQVFEAHAAGFQVATHAIGDEAVRMVLDAYEEALTKRPRANHRHRVEHVEVVRPGLPERFARLGVIASVQPCFTYWEYGDVTRLGPGLAPHGHPWGALRRAGVVLAGGSDNPVLPDFAPLQGIAAAVTRRTRAGLDLGAHQALSLSEALWSYTMGGAYASFEEGIKGSLEPGRLADLVIVSGSPSDPGARIDLTMVGGRVVYERG